MNIRFVMHSQEFPQKRPLQKNSLFKIHTFCSRPHFCFQKHFSPIYKTRFYENITNLEIFVLDH